ncbi:hypothetical protein, partial [Frankia sp. AvcI1]
MSYTVLALLGVAAAV